MRTGRGFEPTTTSCTWESNTLSITPCDKLLLNNNRRYGTNLFLLFPLHFHERHLSRFYFVPSFLLLCMYVHLSELRRTKKVRRSKFITWKFWVENFELTHFAVAKENKTQISSCLKIDRVKVKGWKGSGYIAYCVLCTEWILLAMNDILLYYIACISFFLQASFNL